MSTTVFSVVIYGPPIKSMQYGTAANTESRVSLIDLGEPGRFMIREEPRIPAVCRERIAVGT